MKKTRRKTLRSIFFLKIAKNSAKICKLSAIFNEKIEITMLRKLHNSNRIPQSCFGTFFLVAFFSAATRHAGVLSSSRLLRASSGHLFQMLSWPGSFLSMFFLAFGDSIPQRWPFFPGLDQVLFSPWFSWFLGFDSKTVQRSAFCRSRR